MSLIDFSLDEIKQKKRANKPDKKRIYERKKKYEDAQLSKAKKPINICLFF